MGSAEAPARSFSPCRCLDAHIPASGTVFPIAEPALHEDSSTVCYPALPGASPFPAAPCLCRIISHPFHQPRSHRPGARPPCSSALTSLGNWPVCVRALRLFPPAAPARLRHPEHPFLLPGVALYVPFPRLFHPDLYQVTGIWVPHLSVVAQPLRLGVFPSMTSICPSVAIGNFCSVYSRTGASFVRNNR